MTDLGDSGTITEKLTKFGTEQAREEQANMFQVIVNKALLFTRTDAERTAIDATMRAFKQGQLDFFNTKARFHRLVWALGGENKRKDFRRRRVDCVCCGLLIPYGIGDVTLREHCSPECESEARSVAALAMHDARREAVATEFVFAPGALPPITLKPLPEPVTSLRAAAEAAGLLDQPPVFIGTGGVFEFKDMEMTKIEAPQFESFSLPPLPAFKLPALNLQELPPLDLSGFKLPPIGLPNDPMRQQQPDAEPELAAVPTAAQLQEAGIALAPSNVGVAKVPEPPKLRRHYSTAETVLHRCMKIALQHDPDWHLETLYADLAAWPKTELEFRFVIAEGGGSYVLTRRARYFRITEEGEREPLRTSTWGCALHRNVYITGEFGTYDSITIENILRDYLGLPIRDPKAPLLPPNTSAELVEGFGIITTDTSSKIIAGVATAGVAGKVTLTPPQDVFVEPPASEPLDGEILPPRRTIGDLAAAVDNDEDDAKAPEPLAKLLATKPGERCRYCAQIVEQPGRFFCDDVCEKLHAS